MRVEKFLPEQEAAFLIRAYWALSKSRYIDDNISDASIAEKTNLSEDAVKLIREKVVVPFMTAKQRQLYCVRAGEWSEGEQGAIHRFGRSP